MINLIIWPLVIFIVIMLIIFARRNMHKVMKPYQRKYFLLTYIGLLVIITVVFFIVQPQLVTTEHNNNRPPHVVDAFYETNVLELLEPYKINEWEIPIKDDVIKLTVSYDGYWADVNIPVLVVEDDSREGIAQITSYETPTMIENYDVSQQVQLPSVNIVDENIVIDFSGVEREYTFQAIKNIIPINQFSNISRNNSFSHIHVGEIALIITVPKETAIRSDIQHFHIIKTEKRTR